MEHTLVFQKSIISSVPTLITSNDYYLGSPLVPEEEEEEEEAWWVICCYPQPL
jgi:hypothetical protein